MINTLLRPEQWAESEFARAQLGDRRRTKRLVKIATNLVQSPSGTLPQAFPEWKDLKAAYRFFKQPEIGYQEIQQPHWQKTRAACQQPGQYLLIEDTTELDYTKHPMTENLGSIGDGRGRGFLPHSTLALQVEGWDGEDQPQVIALGLLDQQCWSRWGQPKRKGRETRRQLLSRSRESQRWAAVLEQGGPPVGGTWVYVADRESDFYEPIERCQRQGVDFVIRAFHDRVLSGGGHLKEEVSKAPVRGCWNVQMRARARASGAHGTGRSTDGNGECQWAKETGGQASRFWTEGRRSSRDQCSGRGATVVLAVADVAAVRHLDASATNHRHLHDALVRGGIPQSAQEWGRSGGQPDGAGRSHRSPGGGIGDSGGALAQCQVAGTNLAQRASQRESLRTGVAEAAGGTVRQAPDRLDASKRAGIGGKTWRLSGQTQRRLAGLANDLAWLEPIDLDVSWIRSTEK